MKLSVSCRELVFQIDCGNGQQTFLWVGQATKQRYAIFHDFHPDALIVELVQHTQSKALLLPFSTIISRFTKDELMKTSNDCTVTVHLSSSPFPILEFSSNVDANQHSTTSSKRQSAVSLKDASHRSMYSPRSIVEVNERVNSDFNMWRRYASVPIQEYRRVLVVHDCRTIDQHRQTIANANIQVESVDQTNKTQFDKLSKTTSIVTDKKCGTMKVFLFANTSLWNESVQLEQDELRRGLYRVWINVPPHTALIFRIATQNGDDDTTLEWTTSPAHIAAFDANQSAFNVILPPTTITSTTLHRDDNMRRILMQHGFNNRFTSFEYPHVNLQIFDHGDVSTMIQPFALIYSKIRLAQWDEYERMWDTMNVHLNNNHNSLDNDNIKQTIVNCDGDAVEHNSLVELRIELWQHFPHLKRIFDYYADNEPDSRGCFTKLSNHSLWRLLMQCQLSSTIPLHESTRIMNGDSTNESYADPHKLYTFAQVLNGFVRLAQHLHHISSARVDLEITQQLSHAMNSNNSIAITLRNVCQCR